MVKFYSFLFKATQSFVQVDHYKQQRLVIIFNFLSKKQFLFCHLSSDLIFLSYL